MCYLPAFRRSQNYENFESENFYRPILNGLGDKNKNICLILAFSVIGRECQLLLKLAEFGGGWEAWSSPGHAPFTSVSKLYIAGSF